MIILFENTTYDAPTPEDATDYHEEIGSPSYPVFADTAEALFDAVPYDGSSLPGICLVTPEMELLECTSGHGMEQFLETIQDHAEAG